MQYSVHNSGLPRSISRGLKARIIFSHPRGWIGAMFVSMALLFLVIFSPMTDMNFSNPLDSNPSETSGIITGVEETNAKHNKKVIYAFTFSYSVEGRNYESVSYYSGKGILGRGDSVAVQYDAANPSFSRIKNFRMAPFGSETVLFILVFGVVGLGILLTAVFTGRKNIALVQKGYLTTGKVISKEATRKSVNKRRVYKVYFEYTASDGAPRKGCVKTHQPERLEDDENEQLLFNPDQPDEAVMVDSLPKAVKKYFAGL